MDFSSLGIDMIWLDYNFFSPISDKARAVDLATADEGVLRYEVLLGDIVFQADGCNFSTNWHWIPIIDFVACLRSIVEELSEGEHAESIFEFTESDNTLRFRRDRDSVSISASYADGHCRVGLNEFVGAVDDLSKRFITEMEVAYPTVLRNTSFNSMFPVRKL